MNERAEVKSLQAALGKTQEELKRLSVTVNSIGRQSDRTSRVRCGNISLNPGEGLRIYSRDGKLTGELAPSGNWSAGADLSDPDQTALKVFSVATRYNHENFGASDILLGSNSSASGNIKWNSADGEFAIRGGQVDQVTINTSGELTAGGESVVLNSDGIELLVLPSSTYSGTKALKFSDSDGRVLSKIYDHDYGVSNAAFFDNDPNDAGLNLNAATSIRAIAPITKVGSVTLMAYSYPDDGEFAGDLEFALIADAEPSGNLGRITATGCNLFQTDGALWAGAAISTDSGTTKWGLGGYSASAPEATGFVTAIINGVTIKLLAAST